jgi:hypothetical protein
MQNSRQCKGNTFITRLVSTIEIVVIDLSEFRERLRVLTTMTGLDVNGYGETFRAMCAMSVMLDTYVDNWRELIQLKLIITASGQSVPRS